MATKNITGKDLFKAPAKLSDTIEAYFKKIDAMPPQMVNVGKNLYERRVPYTVEGLCAHLHVQKGDVKQVLNDTAANAQVKRILTDAITYIEAYLTEAALLGQLDPTVAKIVLGGSILSNGSDAELDMQNGLSIVIKGMTPEQVEAASR